LVPVIVIAVPPVVGPELGLTPVTVGGAEVTVTVTEVEWVAEVPVPVTVTG
jgi:hypothetical protein